MKAIINGLLYDTEKSELLAKCEYYSVWKTKIGRYFLTNDSEGYVKETNCHAIQDFLGRRYPDEYIKVFGRVEEA